VYQFESDTPYVLTPTPSTWYRVHGRWDGSFVNLNVWRRIDPEPAGWQYTDTQRFLPYNPATDDAPFLDLYYFPAVDIGGVDNIRIITTESHWVGFGGFQVNSVIKKTASGSLSANSILRGNISGSKTADAVIKRNTTGSFTADAVIA
jgi:hypothetical protein